MCFWDGYLETLVYFRVNDIPVPDYDAKNPLKSVPIGIACKGSQSLRLIDAVNTYLRQAPQTSGQHQAPHQIQTGRDLTFLYCAIMPARRQQPYAKQKTTPIARGGLLEASRPSYCRLPQKWFDLVDPFAGLRVKEMNILRSRREIHCLAGFMTRMAGDADHDFRSTIF